MQQLTKILCPVAFNEPCQQGLREAAWFATEYDAELIILYAIEPLNYPVEYGLTAPQLANEVTDQINQAEIGLRQFVDMYLEVKPPKLTRRVEFGNPAATICRLAEDEKVDLIVIATRAIRGPRHLFDGHTAERVARSAPCPVWTTRLPREDD